MASEDRRDWRALCKLVSVEKNSERLRVLLAELMQMMEEPNEPKPRPLPNSRSILARI